MPTLLRPYTTPDDVRRHLENMNADEETVCEAINRASRFIEDRTGRDFWFHDYSETSYTVKRVDVIGNLLLLPFEIITLTELTQDGEALTEGTEEDYVFEAGDRLVRGAADWSGVITLTGTFGYEITEDEIPPASLPEAISTAAKVIASVYTGLWRKVIRDAAGGSESITMQNVPAETLRSLERFNIRKVRAAF